MAPGRANRGNDAETRAHRSNQGICDRLFLSLKTVEAHVKHIFAKLGLEESPDDHRRVLAVITYLRAEHDHQ